MKVRRGVVNELRSRITNNKVLVQNFSYLSLLQGFNVLLPLITYPYLIATLGAELYGLVIYAQVVVTYFGILVDFGFKVSATKEVSVFQENKDKLSEVVSSVLIIKLFLWIISFVILAIMLWVIPSFESERILFLFSFTICFNDFLFPQWYFQGVERMKYITIINLISRTAFLVLIFTLVNDKNDYLYVPLLNGTGTFIGGSLGLYILFVRDKVIFKWQSCANLWPYFKRSFPIFGSNAVISIKDRMNIVFIGASLGMQQVAIYDLAVKIMGLFMQPIDTINTTIYPRMARKKNIDFLKKINTVTFLVMLFLILAVQPFLEPIINFLGEGLEDAVLPTRILLLAPLIMVFSLSFGRNCLLASGNYKTFSLGMFLTVVFYLLLIALLFWGGFENNILAFIAVTLLVYGFELIYRWTMSKRLKLI